MPRARTHSKMISAMVGTLAFFVGVTATNAAQIRGAPTTPLKIAPASESPRETTTAFGTHLPRNWIVDPTAALANDDGPVVTTLYRNSKSRQNERVYTSFLALIGQTSEWQGTLQLHTNEISNARRDFFKYFGFTDYQILKIEKHPLSTRSGFEFMQVIHAQFRDSRGQQVQTLERQYLAGHRLYITAYAIDTESPDALTQAPTVLDAIEPHRAPQREPNSETVGTHKGGPETLAVMTAPTSNLPNDLDMNSPINQKLCADVPLTERRQPQDPGLMAALQHDWGDAKGCGLGTIDNLRGLAEGTVNMAWDLYRLKVSSSYHDQIRASLGGVLSEITKDPIAFGQRVFSEVASTIERAGQHYFACFKSSRQLRVICDVALGLLDANLLLKIITKAPLTIAEWLQVQRILAKNGDLATPIGPGLTASGKTHLLEGPLPHDVGRATSSDADVPGGRARSFSGNPALQGIGAAGANEVDAGFARALALSARGDKGAALALMPTLAGYGGSIADLEAKVLSTPGLMAAEKLSLHQDFQRDIQAINRIRGSYPKLATIAQEDQGHLVTLIHQLESKGVPKSKIEAQLSSSVCLIP